MHEIEINEIPPLQADEQSLLDVHGLLNVFNVFRGELALIGLTLANNYELLGRGLALCDQLVANLRDPGSALSDARRMDAHTAAIFAEVDAAMEAHAGFREHPEIVESLANLHSVFAILRMRADEHLARARQPERWEEFSVDGLRRDLFDFFTAIEKNSHGRFRITYDATTLRPGDYHVNFKIENSSGNRLRMPPVFRDVLHDLIANARKYTAPGGRITVSLHENARELQIRVEDTGRGIPADEMTAVVQFGRRASNVADVRTMGGGFGLTKAFFATKRFGGRFWLASELGVGTRVRICLPRPEDQSW